MRQTLRFPIVIFALFFTLFPVLAQEPLPIPPLLDSHTNSAGERVFDLQVQEGSRTFAGNRRTRTLGYNGDYLGPTLRVRRGEAVRFRVRNTLEEATTVHWHGAHLPATSDGGPHQRVPPGQLWEAPFEVDQQAATLWYHPHLLGTTAEQVYRGLAGFLLVDDEQSDSLAIPKQYGRNDIPLVLQERRFNANGSFRYRPGMPDVMRGFAGNALLTNGSVEPSFGTRDGTVRFRLLNGSNSTVLRISFAGGDSFEQIASDGGFLETPITRDAVVLSPGERAEVLVHLDPRSSDDEPMVLLAESNGGNRYRALLLYAEGPLSDSRPAPKSLVEVPPIPPSEATRRRQFVMSTMGPGGRLTINGKTMDLDRIDEEVPLGATEIWEVVNATMGGRGMMGGMMQVPHSFHVHGLQFQVLRLNGQRPPAELRGWKDTVLLWPEERVELILRFTDYTGIFMYHCHLLEHEDNGMMGQYEVKE